MPLLSYQAEGNPLYAQTITQHLHASGLLQQANGLCDLPTPLADVGVLPVPATMREAVVNVVDSLPPRQQLILKVAAVLPEPFAVQNLHALLPPAITHDRLLADLGALVKLHLLQQEQPYLEQPPLYRFAHRFGRDVVQGLLLQTQRQKLLA